MYDCTTNPFFPSFWKAPQFALYDFVEVRRQVRQVFSSIFGDFLNGSTVMSRGESSLTECRRVPSGDDDAPIATDVAKPVTIFACLLRLIKSRNVSREPRILRIRAIFLAENSQGQVTLL